MKYTILKLLPILIIILSVFSVQQWLKFTISNTTLIWIIVFAIILSIITFVNKINYKITNYISAFDLKVLNIYFIWLAICTIRGMFIAENYWEWKQLIEGCQALLLPITIYIFSIPFILKNILKLWMKYALYIFLLIVPFLGKDAYHFYLGPIFLLGCFISLFSRKWQIILGILLIIMLSIDLGARSQVIKSGIVIIIALGIYLKKYIPINFLKFLHWSCYIIPIVLLYLGISGKFNIFEDLASNQGKYVEKKVRNGQIIEEDLSVDTRTFIYREVITSAVNHDYIICGRTPARGNDSQVFGSFSAEILKTGKYERHSNELCHTNVFTWIGIIGLLLYSFIYLRSSYLALYKSNNIYIKYLGCFIAFRWAFGWIEDFNKFDIMNLSLWMLISIGLSYQFRKMNNKEFTSIIKSILHHEKNSMAL